MDKASVNHRLRDYERALLLGGAASDRSLSLSLVATEVAHALDDRKNRRESERETEGIDLAWNLWSLLQGDHDHSFQKGLDAWAKFSNDLDDIEEERSFRAKFADELILLQARATAVQYALQNDRKFANDPARSLLRDLRHRYLEEQALEKLSKETWDYADHKGVWKPTGTRVLKWLWKVLIFGPIWLAAVIFLYHWFI